MWMTYQTTTTFAPALHRFNKESTPREEDRDWDRQRKAFGSNNNASAAGAASVSGLSQRKAVLTRSPSIQQAVLTERTLLWYRQQQQHRLVGYRRTRSRQPCVSETRSSSPGKRKPPLQTLSEGRRRGWGTRVCGLNPPIDFTGPSYWDHSHRSGPHPPPPPVSGTRTANWNWEIEQ